MESCAYTILCFALHREAAPWIETLKLKKDSNAVPYECFVGENVLLVVSGPGKIRASAGLSFCLGRYSPCRERSLAFSIGICGTRDKSLSPGQLVLPSSIEDFATKKAFYPDLYLDHGLVRPGLCTVDIPVGPNSSIDTTARCFDMEAAGVFQIAQSYLGSDQVFAVKIVSDYCDGTSLSGKEIQELLEASIATSQTLIEKERNRMASRTRLLTHEDEELLRAVSTHVRFSEAQHLLLCDLVRGYVARTGSFPPLVHSLSQKSISSKHEARRTFEEIKNELSL